MAVVVTHATAIVAAGAGDAEIGKNEWNANHTITGLGTMAEATAADYSTTAQIAAAYQPLDGDLTTIAGLTATTNNIIQSVSSAWASRTPTEVTATLINMVGDSGSGGTKGLVPAPASGDAAAGKFLKADGTWAAPSGASDPLTLTSLLTITQDTAIEGIVASTGYSLTGSNATNMLDLAGTWNTSGNPIALKIAITNTASGSTSKFISCLAGASGTTEVFSVAKTGVGTFTGTASGNYTALQFSVQGNGNIALGEYFGILVVADTIGSKTARMGPTDVSIPSTGVIGFGSSGSVFGGGSDTALNRDAAGVFAARVGTTAHVFRVYDTYTSSTNYHRVGIATARATLSGVTGASVTATGIIPVGAVVVGVTTKVTTGLGTGSGTTGYTVGDGSDVDRWGAIVGTASGTSSDNTNWTSGTIQAFTAASDVVITASGGNFDGTGVIYVSVQYLIGQCD